MSALETTAGSTSASSSSPALSLSIPQPQRPPPPPPNPQDRLDQADDSEQESCNNPLLGHQLHDSEQENCNNPLLEHQSDGSAASRKPPNFSNCGRAGQTPNVQAQGDNVTVNNTRTTKDEEETSNDNARAGDSVSMSQSLLRAIGLKAVSSGLRKLRRQRVLDEPEKFLVSRYRRLALSQATVHLLPVGVSIALICINWKGHLHGEYLDGVTQFSLQIAAKFQELAIVASLGTLIFQSVRHNLLHGDGLSLGIVGSGFCFSSISFLWSADFLCTFRTPYRLRGEIWLLLFVVLSSILASTVGPASALLFIPSLTWWPAGGTEFYLRGTVDQLWPTHLTIKNTGGDNCLQNTSPERVWCVNGGYLPLLGLMAAHTTDPKGTWDIHTGDRGGERAMSVGEPRDTSGLTGTEIWAFGVHAATAWLAQDNEQKWNIASELVKGSAAKYKFMGTISTFAKSQIPVVRAVCGPVQDIKTRNSLDIQFPVLDSDKPWWNNTASLDVRPTWGFLMNFSIADESLFVFSNTQQARARWILLPSTFGAATAGLVFVSQNASHAVSRGCTVDSRWAQGEIWTAPSALIKPFYSHIGNSSVPLGDDRPINFFAKKSLYSKTLQADQVWLNATSPLLPPSANGYQMSTFESLLNITLLSNPEWVSTDSVARRLLEYTICLHFVDALSRIGWDLQAVTPGNQFLIDPTLEQKYSGDVNSPEGWVNQMMRGGKAYKRPDPSVMPTTVSHYYQYRQGYAWTLDGTGVGGKLAITCLLVHVSIAVAHCCFILVTGQASQAWDSVPELLALAYNSLPRGAGLQNCGSGIQLMKTLNRAVRVGVCSAEIHGDHEKVQMVVAETPESSEQQGGLEKLGLKRAVVGKAYG